MIGCTVAKTAGRARPAAAGAVHGLPQRCAQAVSAETIEVPMRTPHCDSRAKKKWQFFSLYLRVPRGATRGDKRAGRSQDGGERWSVPECTGQCTKRRPKTLSRSKASMPTRSAAISDSAK